MKKSVLKVISILLTIITTVGIVNINTVVTNAETLNFGEWEYEIALDGKYAVITGYSGTDTSIEIPSVIDGKSVAVIGPSAFEGNTSIKEVTIPSSVSSIRKAAFENCTSLQKVNLNDGLVEIHQSFVNTAIKSVTIPSTVEYLNIQGFSNEYITEMIIEGSNARYITTWSPKITSYGDSFRIVFKGKPDVQSDINLRSAGYTFCKEDGNYCYKIETNTSTSETYISGDYTYSLNNGEAAIIRYNNFTAEETVVPQTIDGYPVTAVCDFAFSPVSEVTDTWGNTTVSYSYKLKKVTLPEGVKTVGRYAFAENRVLTEVILPESLTDLDYCAFMNCKNLTTINIPDSVECLPDALFLGCKSLKTLNLHEHIKTICDKAVSVSYNTTEAKFNIVIPDSVEYLGEAIYSDCEAQTVTLPDNLVAMRGTFRKSEDIKDVVFNDSLQIIGDNTFYSCTGLEEITIPDSVFRLGKSAFYKCTGLKKVTLSDNVNKINVLTFAYCTSLTEFNWNAEKQFIEDSAFLGCTLQSFDFSKTQSIDKNAFSETNIEKAKIGQPESDPDNKIGVGAQSFMNCNELEMVALGGNVDEVGSKAFADCSKLETVVISDSVTKIAEDAFEGSENVTIYCFANSYAETFATENKIRVTTLVISPIPNQTYTTKKIEPELTVSMSSQKLGSDDYSAEYYNNINVGTASVIVSGKGDLDMLVSKAEFAIVAKNIADVRISNIPSQSYDNSAAVKPEVTLKYNGVRLKQGTDYTVSYQNNHAVGTATVKIKGIGNYKGTATVNFQIVDKEENAFVRFINAVKNFFVSAWNWFIGLFKN